MSERDDLAALIWGVEADEIGTFKTGVTSKAADDIADAILAAGWRPPTPPAHAIEYSRPTPSGVIPAEAVEAAAKAAYIRHSNEPGFDAEAAWNDMAGTDDWEREQWESNARAALEAAAPHMAAQALGNAAEAIDADPYDDLDPFYAGWLRDRARKIREEA